MAAQKIDINTDQGYKIATRYAGYVKNDIEHLKVSVYGRPEHTAREAYELFTSAQVDDELVTFQLRHMGNLLLQAQYIDHEFDAVEVYENNMSGEWYGFENTVVESVLSTFPVAKTF